MAKSENFQFESPNILKGTGANNIRTLANSHFSNVNNLYKDVNFLKLKSIRVGTFCLLSQLVKIDDIFTSLADIQQKTPTPAKIYLDIELHLLGFCVA